MLNIVYSVASGVVVLLVVGTSPSLVLVLVLLPLPL
jgi:hypothetical protein